MLFSSALIFIYQGRDSYDCAEDYSTPREFLGDIYIDKRQYRNDENNGYEDEDYLFDGRFYHHRFFVLS